MLVRTGSMSGNGSFEMSLGMMSAPNDLNGATMTEKKAIDGMMSGQCVSAQDRREAAGNVESDRQVTAPPLEDEAELIIKRKLRDLYQTRIEEPLPDKFAALLDRLSKS